MNRLTEPILVIVAGGTTLVQAVLRLLIVFGWRITPEQEAAITTVAGILISLLARSQVVPTNQLPPGVANQMADAKAAKAADKAGS